MKFETITLFLCLIICYSALHIPVKHEQDLFPSGKVNLKADNGKYLSVCDDCGSAAYQYSASVTESSGSTPSAIWIPEKIGNQIALKSNIGNYLGICVKCWTKSTPAESAFVHATSPNIQALWAPEKLANGKWAFRSFFGYYLARCNGCVTGGTKSDFAFVNSPSSTNPLAQWDVQQVSQVQKGFPLGKVNLIADSGKYLARCNNCGPGADPDSAGIHASSGQPASSTWTAEKVGDKIAFKSDTGKYLARCNGCWRGGADPDSAFVHVSTPSGNPWALWTPEKLDNGKWAFKSDNGKYLARCNSCVPGGATPDFAFVHSPTSEYPWAQWTVKTKL